MPNSPLFVFLSYVSFRQAMLLRGKCLFVIPFFCLFVFLSFFLYFCRIHQCLFSFHMFPFRQCSCEESNKDWAAHQKKELPEATYNFPNKSDALINPLAFTFILDKLVNIHMFKLLNKRDTSKNPPIKILYLQQTVVSKKNKSLSIVKAWTFSLKSTKIESYFNVDTIGVAFNFGKSKFSTFRNEIKTSNALLQHPQLSHSEPEMTMMRMTK